MEFFASGREKHARSTAPYIHAERWKCDSRETRNCAAGKNRSIICGSKRSGCDWRCASGIADAGIYARAKIKIRAGDFGSLRERAPPGFFAAQRRSLERRIAGAPREARDAVRVGGDAPARRHEKLPQHDVR